MAWLKVLFFTAAFCFLSAFVSCSPGNKYRADTRRALEDGRTVVERYGQLRIAGTDLCNEHGKPVQLRGMSSHGLQWHGKYANEEVIGWLRDDWNCQLWRAAMYLTEGGYLSAPMIKNKVIDSIEAAIKLGVYVIVDWHVLGSGNPLSHQEKAVEFFSDIARTYGNHPNIIYEICNEPNGADVTWNESIKPYAEAVVKAIRAYDRDNIVIVGTPNWSQDVDIASENKISDPNLMYSLHFYAGSHGKELRKKAETALKNGAPVFVTEWGTTRNTGDGGVFEKQSKEWLVFMRNSNISWANWSVSNKGEDSGILKFNADRNGRGGWTQDDLSPDGIFMRKVLRNELPL